MSIVIHMKEWLLRDVVAKAKACVQAGVPVADIPGLVTQALLGADDDDPEEAARKLVEEMRAKEQADPLFPLIGGKVEQAGCCANSGMVSLEVLLADGTRRIVFVHTADFRPLEVLVGPL